MLINDYHMAIVDITEFEKLINNSKLDGKYKSLIKGDIIYAINQNKGVGFDFVNNDDFLKTIKVILNCKQQDSEIYTLLTSYTKFGRLISNSKLSERYKLYAMNYVACIINTNKGKNSDFVNNEDFLKTIKVILNCKQQDSEIYTLLTSYVESCIRPINNSKLGNLINNSKLDGVYKASIIEDIINLINTNKGIEFDCVNNDDFLKTIEVILNSSIQEDMKYLSIMGTILCLKDNNEQQKKSSIILYALLASYGVIITYAEQTKPRALCIKRPNNKRSDVKMSDYLLDSQMIEEDMSWLKKTDQEAFQKLHDQIEKMQDPEVKKTFDYYCNQINSHEKREALKYTALAFAIVCTASVGIAIKIAIKTENTTAWLIAAVTGIIAVVICGYLLCSSRLECVELEKIKNPPKHPIDNPTCIFIK